MSVQIVAGTAAARTTAGTQDLTGLGSITPKAIMLFASRVISEDFPIDHASMSMGVGAYYSGTIYQGGTGIRSENGVANSDTGGYRGNDIILSIQDPTFKNDFDIATLSSFGVGKATINWIQRDTAEPWRLTYILFGDTGSGDILTARVGDIVPNENQNGSVTITPGFAADLVFIIGRGRDTSASTYQHGYFTFGACERGGGQGFVLYGQRDAISDTNVVSQVYSGYTAGEALGGSNGAQFEVHNFTSTQFSVTTRNTSSSVYCHMYYLALDYGSSDSYVAIVDSPTSTGNASFTGPGFTPQLWMWGGSFKTATGSYTDGDSFSVGVASNTEESCVSISDEDGVGTTNTQSLSSSVALDHRKSNGSNGIKASFAQWLSTGAQFNFTVVDSSPRKLLAVALKAGVLYRTGSISANATIKNSLTKIIGANATVFRTKSGSITAGAYVKQVPGGSITANAVVKSVGITLGALDITQRGSSTYTSTSQNISHSISVPSSVIAGDLLLMSGGQPNGRSGDSVTDPSGWTRVSLNKTPSATVGSANLVVCYRIATSDDAGRFYEWKLTRSGHFVGSITAFYNHDPNYPIGPYDGCGFYAPSVHVDVNVPTITNTIASYILFIATTTGEVVFSELEPYDGIVEISTSVGPDGVSHAVYGTPRLVPVATGIKTAVITGQQSSAGTHLAITAQHGTFVDAYIVRRTSGSISVNATIKLGPQFSFSADAVIKLIKSAVLTANATVQREISAAIVASAVIKSTLLPPGISVDSDITSIGLCVWVSPDNGASIGTTPTFEFTMPEVATGNMHFHMQIDTEDTFDTANLRNHYTMQSTIGWQYHDGVGWQPFPGSGVNPIYAGNNCRYTVQSSFQLESNTNYHRRVRAGV